MLRFRFLLSFLLSPGIPETTRPMSPHLWYKEICKAGEGTVNPKQISALILRRRVVPLRTHFTRVKG